MIELARIGGLSSVVQKGNKTAPEKKGIYAFLWPNIQLYLASNFTGSGARAEKTPSRMEQYQQGIKKLRRFKYDGDLWITTAYASLLGGKIKRYSKDGNWVLVDSDDARKASQRMHNQYVSDWNYNEGTSPKAMGYHGFEMEWAQAFIPAHKGKIKGKKPNARRVAARSQTRYDAKPRVRYEPTINASSRVSPAKRLSDALSKAFPTYADDSYSTFDELAEGIISGVEEILEAAVSNLVQKVEQTKKDRRFEMGRQVETVISHPVQRGYDYDTCYAYEEIVHPDSVTWTVHGRVNVAKAVQDTLKETARYEKIDLRKLSSVWKTVSGYYERAIWENTVGSIEPFEDSRWNPSNSGDMYESVWKAWEGNIHMSFSTSDEDPSCADIGELSLPDEREEKWRFWRGKAKATDVGKFDLPYKAEVEIEGTGNSHATRTASRVAAKYKNKKQVDKADGSGKTTVYEYSKGQVDHRNREKAKRIEKLKSQIGKLRSQLKSDLKSDDPKTKLTALAVCLMDQTCERVGNDNSVKERGHFGVTTLQAKHVKIRGSKATLTYKGKSGVDQKKTVTDAVTVKAIKDAIKGKSGSDTILCEGDDCTVRAADVNKYLKKYDITAKDIRGFRANDEMVRQLEKHRKGKLPEDKKEREKKLKEEFDAALEATAAVVGHEASTLKNQYLVPKMEDQYKGDGTVMKKWDKKASNVSNALAGLTTNIKMVEKMLKILPTDHSYQTMRFLNGFWLALGKDALKAADIILNTKDIPPKRNKAVEMAIRITGKAARERGKPNRFEQWWQKNRKRYDVLIEALSFPEKKMGGESLFKIGSLTVHNTIGATGKDLDGFKKALRKAVSLIKKSNGVVPGGLSKVLYGEVYYVGSIGRAHHAAWYDLSQDKLYIRPPKASWGMNIVETIIHEFGHRYYQRFMPKDEKWKWQMHHEIGVSNLGLEYEVKPLEVGEQIPLRIKGAPRGWRPSVSKVEKYYYHYETWDGREKTTSRFKMDDFRRTQERKKALYPTVYSTTNEEEHFCEALARVCSGNLSKPHLDAFHTIFSGKKSKKAETSERWVKLADLSPQLGWPGGTCHVVERIRDEVRNPRTREHLVEKVEDGDKLTNPEANKIYDMQSDRGSKVKFLQRMAITPHAQYRMDQRGITVNDLRMALNNFGKAFYDSKSRNGYQYKKWTEEISWGKEIRWVDEKNGDLVLVFKADGRGGVLIITAFWEGMSDPKPSTCKVADRYTLSNM